jgi:hypothetical protein
MADFWGPALDAELAYRHERLFTALRGIPERDGHAASEAPAAEGASVALAATAGPDAPVRPAAPAHPRAAAARGWLLRGSGAWHVAR